MTPLEIPQKPLTIQDLSRLSVEDLATSSQLNSLPTEVNDWLINDAPDKTYNKIEVARSIVNDREANKQVELPKEKIEFHFKPSKKQILSQTQATVFVGKYKETTNTENPSSPYDFSQRKIVVFIAPFVNCSHGACGVPAHSVKEGYTFQTTSLGSIHQQTSRYQFQWGSGAPEYEFYPVLGDPDYHGPSPSKLADWIKEQVLTEINS